MSITIFQGVPWGVYKYTQPDGGGTTQPRVLSAVSTGVNTVRVTFDRTMNFDFNPRNTGLIVTNYQIQRLSDSVELDVLRVTKITDTVVDLLTVDQEGVSYRLTVLSATDVWDNDVDPLYDTYDFTGTAPIFPAITDVGSFFGLEGGMQHELNADVTPDADPPYLGTLNPSAGQPDVSILTDISLEIKDDRDGVNPATVVITVEGHTVWIGEAAQPGYAVTKTAIAGGYRYDINPNVPLPDGTAINVTVYAKDFSFFQNVLNTSYYFTTVEGTGPTVSNQTPAPNQDQVPLDSTVAFRLTDVDDDLDPTSVVITINGVTAYSGQLNRNGFSVTRTPVSLGYDYVITAPETFLYGAEVEIGIIAEDYSDNQVLVRYSFFTVEDPNCFTGPLNEFEERVKAAFTTAGIRYLEYLRVWMLRYALNVIHTDRAVRWVYTKAYEHPASTILNQLVPTPSSGERTASLCGRRTNIQVNNDLKEHPLVLERALTELTILGTPDKHRKTLQAYLSTGNPNDRVPVACLMLLLARALEDNELI